MRTPNQKLVLEPLEAKARATIVLAAGWHKIAYDDLQRDGRWDGGTVELKAILGGNGRFTPSVEVLTDRGFKTTRTAPLSRVLYLALPAQRSTRKEAQVAAEDALERWIKQNNQTEELR